MSKRSPFSSWSDFGIFLLTLIGIAPPLTVQCWYCHQTSYLLEDGQETYERWHCKVCDSDNLLDETGTIIDQVDAMFAEQPSKIEMRSCRPAKNPISSKDIGPNIKLPIQKGKICDQCMQAISENDLIMKNYIPDESDPLYKSNCYYSDALHTGLVNGTPLCRNCDELVRETIGTSKEKDWQPWRSDMMIKLQTAVPNQPTAKKYFSLATGWTIMHAISIMICLYIFIFMPFDTDKTQKTFLEKVQMDMNKISDILQTFFEDFVKPSKEEFWGDYLADMFKKCIRWIGNQILSSMQYTKHASLCTLTVPIAFLSNSCYNPSTHNPFMLVVASYLLTKNIVWHVFITGTNIMDMRDVKYWKVYVGYHNILFYLRLLSPLIARYCSPTIIRAITGSMILSFPLAVYLSIHFVVYSLPKDILFNPVGGKPVPFTITPEKREMLLGREDQSFEMTDDMRAQIRADLGAIDPPQPKPDPDFKKYQFEDEDYNLSPRSLNERQHHLMTRGYNTNYEKTLYRLESMQL
ncbi:hypothetical protein J3Q64DRAFT_1847375 [Phycomyces blakesleeanus]|uniref:Ima1 N-terminal domain-containing protein n=1 Tax=Phycomyces blakesleeanus TaxID=4837 RepID=A0ABR3B616_PHYBL